MAFGKCSLNSTSGYVGNETRVGNTAGTPVGAFILTLVFLVGFPGNIFVAWSILARARKKSVTTLIILNLAIADGSVMALTPFFIIYLVLKRWIFGNLMCKVVFYLCMANMYASIHLIMLMSVHRLVAVVWPHHVSKISSRGRVLKVLVVFWVLVLVTSLPTMFFRETRCTIRSTIICDLIHSKESHVVMHYMLELLFGFLIPYPIIIVSYICVLRRIRQTKFRRRIRSEKLILAIVVTFCIFWLPYHIVNMVQVTWTLYPAGPTKDTLHRIWLGSRVVTSSVAFISSCVNPVLYFFAGKSYIRREGLEFMARLFEVAAVDLGNRKSPGNSRDSCDKDKEAEAVMPEDKDTEEDSHLHAMLEVKDPEQCSHLHATLEDKDPEQDSHIHSSASVIHPASTEK